MSVCFPSVGSGSNGVWPKASDWVRIVVSRQLNPNRIPAYRKTDQQPWKKKCREILQGKINDAERASLFNIVLKRCSRYTRTSIGNACEKCCEKDRKRQDSNPQSFAIRITALTNCATLAIGQLTASRPTLSRSFFSNSLTWSKFLCLLLTILMISLATQSASPILVLACISKTPLQDIKKHL